MNPDLAATGFLFENPTPDARAVVHELLRNLAFSGR